MKEHVEQWSVFAQQWLRGITHTAACVFMCVWPVFDWTFLMQQLYRKLHIGKWKCCRAACLAGVSTSPSCWPSAVATVNQAERRPVEACIRPPGRCSPLSLVAAGQKEDVQKGGRPSVKPPCRSWNVLITLWMSSRTRKTQINNQSVVGVCCLRL